MESLFKQYFDNLPCYISVQNHNLRIIDANKQFKENFGDKIGAYCFEGYKGRTEKCQFCPVETTFRDGRQHGGEEVVQTLNGRMISVLVYTTPIFSGDNDLVAVMKTCMDISELKILQEQLRESQERFRLLFDEVPCYISILDRGFNLVQVNRRFREDFGNPGGGHCYEIYKHRKDVCHPCPAAEVFNTKEVHTHEDVVTSLSGEQMNVLSLAAPILDRDGQINHVMELSTNITQIRNLQSQLTSLGLLIGSISHGLKGLLNGVDGGFYLVNSGLEKSNQDRVKKGWEMVERNVGRIRNMVMDILYYAKDREPKYENLSAQKVVEEISALLTKKAQDMGVGFTQSVEPTAGEFDGDGQAVRAMLVNILENSLDACRVDRKQDKHGVSFSARGDAEHIIFEVADNGIGMDRETREKIFTLFFSSKGAEGTGLGLFIANKIAMQHSGNIGVESEEGKGTKFVITLPRRRAGSAAG